jgi:hypothetical protein
VPILKEAGKPPAVVLFVTCAFLKTLGYGGLNFITKRLLKVSLSRDRVKLASMACESTALRPELSTLVSF